MFDRKRIPSEKEVDGGSNWLQEFLIPKKKTKNDNYYDEDEYDEKEAYMEISKLATGQLRKGEQIFIYLRSNVAQEHFFHYLMKANAALKINYVEISNFKSFKGTVKVGPGPFQNLTTIVDPNGCGKSNIVDAVLLALGLNPHKMKHKAEDLICKSKDSPDDITSVAIIFQEDNELESSKRELKGTTNSYYINNKKLANHQKYIAKLSVYNINLKRGCLSSGKGDLLYSSAVLCQATLFNRANKRIRCL
jgi:RecF/RecN/SMC N terminal domain